MVITLKSIDEQYAVSLTSDTLADLSALSVAARRPVHELAAEAVESLRLAIVRTPSAEGAKPGRKGRS